MFDEITCVSAEIFWFTSWRCSQKVTGNKANLKTKEQKKNSSKWFSLDVCFFLCVISSINRWLTSQLAENSFAPVSDTCDPRRSICLCLSPVCTACCGRGCCCCSNISISAAEFRQRLSGWLRTSVDMTESRWIGQAECVNLTPSCSPLWDLLDCPER